MAKSWNRTACDKTRRELDAVSTGACPGCEQCRDAFDSDLTMEAFDEAWQRCEVYVESSFSWSSCGICGSTLGGDREPWHWIDEDNEIQHEDDACIDCVYYMANGEGLE